MKQWALGLMSNDEKRNILDQHKTLYNGYKTMQPQVSNTQPLYMQDFANDKNGVTVNNKGNVKTYMNVGINEQVEEKGVCSECGGMMYEGECSECGYNGGEMGEEMQQVKDLKNVEDLNLSDKFDYVEKEIDEVDISDLIKGKKYKFKHPDPESEDDIEFDDEYETSDDKIYKFKGKHTHALPKKSVEYFVDYLDEDDALDADAMQNVTGQDIPHDADDMAPDGMDDDSDDNRAMMADSEMEEQVGGGSAPYTNYSSIKDPYVFISGGPLKEDGEDDEWEEIDVFSDVDEDLKESVVKQKNKIMEMMNRMKGFN